MDNPVHLHDAEGRRGRQGTIVVVAEGGVSRVVEAGAGNPLKVLVSRASGVAAWTWLASYGGGLLAGDVGAMELSVGPGAHLFLGSQSSTKIFRSEDDREATMTVRATVGDGGVLVLLPDPVAPFAGSRLRQSIHVELGNNAGLVVLDAVTAGRSARGEHWDQDAYRSRLAVDQGGRPLLRDALELAGGQRERLGGWGCLATLTILGAPCVALATSLLAEVGSALAGPWRDSVELGLDPPGVLVAASPRGDGCVLRLAAPRWSVAEAWLHARLGGLAPLIDGAPWKRQA